MKLKRPMTHPPEGFTGLAAHGLSSLDGIKFYEAVDVKDPDDPKTYKLDLQGSN